MFAALVCDALFWTGAVCWSAQSFSLFVFAFWGPLYGITTDGENGKGFALFLATAAGGGGGG
jgi:hypothetical protein